MSSLLTNASAMTALQTLQSTNKNLATTQNRIATGERVSTAQDNAAYWSIATTMRSDNKALSSVQDALGLGAGRLDTAYTAMDAAIKVVDEIKQKVVSAFGASDEDKGKIQTEIGQYIEQLKGIATSANYAGSNLLATDDDATELSIVSSYNRASDGTVSVGTITVDLEAITLMSEDGQTATALLGDVLDIDVEAADDDTALQTILDDLETVLSSMATAAATLGSAKTRVDLQQDFASKLADAIDRGVGQLVDADMNAESARLSALQTQQQLGVQALSIANQNSQNILSLFR